MLELRDRGTTIVFSTHDMATAERLCDRIFMIFRGRRCSTARSTRSRRSYGARHDPRAHRRRARRARRHARRRRSSTRATCRRCACAGDPQAFLRALVGADRRASVRGDAAVAARHLRAHRAAGGAAPMSLAEDPRRRRSGVPRADALQGVPRQHRRVADLDPRAQLRAAADLRARRHIDEALRRHRSDVAATTTAVADAAQKRDAEMAAMPQTGDASRRSRPSASTSPAAGSTTCALALSERVRKEELFAFVEIPADAATREAALLLGPSRVRRSARLDVEDARRQAARRPLRRGAPRSRAHRRAGATRSRRRRSACGRATPTDASIPPRSRTRCARSSSRWRRCSCSSSSSSARCRSS